MQRNNAKRIALGGMMAAVAMVIMCLGGLIPVATYVCPMLCCAIQFIVLALCGKRIAWAWFGVVTILALLMGPDKEAAVVFAVIGYYPLIKTAIEKHKLSWLMKGLYFNASILIAYGILIQLLGLEQIAQENTEFGLFGMLLLLVMGNVVFFLLDKLLTLMAGKWR